MPKAAKKKKRSVYASPSTPLRVKKRAGKRAAVAQQARSVKNEWFELRRSGIQGLGAFATKDIPKGTRIIEYTGEHISNAEGDRRYEETGMRRHHTLIFILNARTVVDAGVGGNDSRFINHSCDPNCDPIIVRGHIWIVSSKRIRAGTELTYDYMYDDDDEYTEEDLRFYACHCGSRKCRGTIVKVDRRKRRNFVMPGAPSPAEQG